MAFLSESELASRGFKKLGRNVKISDKASIYNADQIELGDNSRIDDFCVLSGRVIIGRNVHIAVFCNVAGGEKGVTFEDFSGLAYGCHVFSQSDDYSGRSLTNPTVPDEYKTETKAAVLIRKAFYSRCLFYCFSRCDARGGDFRRCNVNDGKKFRAVVYLFWCACKKN